MKKALHDSKNDYFEAAPSNTIKTMSPGKCVITIRVY